MLWLKALAHDTSLVVPEPLTTNNGGLFECVSHPDVPTPRYAVCFRWVEGEHLNAELTPTHLKSLGTYVATLHRHAENFTFPAELLQPRYDVDSLKEGMNWSALGKFCTDDEIHVHSQILECLRQTMDAIGTGRQDAGTIHGDLHQFNYLFKGFSARALDFEGPGWGYYLYDIAVTLVYLKDMPLEFVSDAPQENYAELRDAYLSGYQTVRLLPEQFETHIEVFKTYKILRVTRWILNSPHIMRQGWFSEYLKGSVQILRRILYTL
ncbi:phosphotransferase [Candidatus Poribacteria bacterium]|nr:phosphotransferase [Candidatus Poribacteria bacterium]